MTTTSKSQAEMAAEKYADSRTITRDLERASVIASFEAGTHYADEEMERLRAEMKKDKLVMSHMNGEIAVLQEDVERLTADNESKENYWHIFKEDLLDQIDLLRNKNERLTKQRDLAIKHINEWRGIMDDAWIDDALAEIQALEPKNGGNAG